MLARVAPIALAAMLCAAAPAAAHEKLPAALAALSPAEFAQDIRITDDPLSSTIVVSTEAGYTRTRALKGALADDVHLRALIDRSTGKATWQVWHEIAYVGGEKDLHAVHYQAGGAARAARPFHVSHRLDRCPPTDAVGFCGQASRIGFELSEDVVREIAVGYAAGSRKPWSLRFEDAGGKPVLGGLAPGEAAGLLLAVAQWRESQS